MQTITVFCGSSDKIHPEYLSAARALGQELARRGLNLAFGAGRTGLMGAVADGALEFGGQVLGVIPEVFYTPKLAHNGLTGLEIAPDLLRSKQRLMDLADAFIVLPGGYGTFSELFEILTWAQVGLNTKPIGLLNVRGYFDQTQAMLEHVQAEGFIYPEHLALFGQAAGPGELLDWLEAYQPPVDLERWVTRPEG